MLNKFTVGMVGWAILLTCCTACMAGQTTPDTGQGQRWSSWLPWLKTKPDASTQQLRNLSFAISNATDAVNSLTNTIMRDGLVHHVELMKHAQGELENLEQEIKNGMINTPRPDGEWYPVRGDKKRNVMSRFVDKEETSELFVSDANKKNIQWLHYAVTDRMVFSFSIKGYADNDFSAFAHKHQVPGEGYDFNFFGDGHIATATGFGLPGVLEFHPNGRLQRFTMKPQIITTNATWLYTGDFYEALWDENGKLVKSNETHPTPESIARAKKVASWFKPEKGEQ